jgi:ribosomal-protein-alanine N-acetyltransferase
MRGGEPMRIRPMRETDLDRVVEIAAGLPHAPHWPRTVYEAALKPWSPRRVSLVAEVPESGTSAGFAIARLSPPEAELETIAVAAEFQGRGIGRELLRDLGRAVGNPGVSEIVLEVRASNLAALGLYHSLGFQEEGRRIRYYADPIEDAVLMRLRLGAHGELPRATLAPN